MIIEMKNVALLTLENEKLSALKKLRQVGVMHIKSSFRKDSGDRSLLEKEYESVEKLLVLFSSVKQKEISAKTLSQCGVFLFYISFFKIPQLFFYNHP